MNINYLLEAFDKDNINRFRDIVKLKSFSSQFVSLSFPTFDSYSSKTISDNFMVFCDKENPEFLKIFCEGSTKDLGLVPGYFMVTKIKIPKDFPVNNNGNGYIVFSILDQENMDVTDIETNITYFCNMIEHHDFPFTENIITDGSPIFCFFLISKPHKNNRGAIGFINIGGYFPSEFISGSSDIIRCVAVNLTE